MHRLIASLLLTTALVASAQEKREIKEQDLGRKDAKALDTSLAGDITREKEEASAAPALQYDAFRLGVELQVADKRHAQIESLKKIIAYSTDATETPKLLFRLGELYWEESKYFFFEANRQDDAFIEAMNRKDAAGQELAKSEKKRLQGEQKRFVGLALEQYKEIVQRHRDFERSDEVLFFLGQLLMEGGEETAALKSYQRLIAKYPQSKFLPDAYLAFGEYYFNNSKARTDWLEKALKAYEKAASYPESQNLRLRHLQAGLVLLQPRQLHEGQGPLQGGGALRRALRRRRGGEGRQLQAQEQPGARGPQRLRPCLRPRG